MGLAQCSIASANSMKRREFIRWFGGAAVAWSSPACGQPRPRLSRIGYLSPLSAAEEAAGYRDEFRAGLRDLGYVEGDNLRVEYRYAEGDRLALFRNAVELVAEKVDVIVTYGVGTEDARHATLLIPIVTLVQFADPVGQLVPRLSRPGGNITGSAVLLPELMIKRLELLKQSVPSLKAVGILLLRDNPSNNIVVVPLEMASKALGVELRPIEASGRLEYQRAFSTWSEAKIDAVVIADQPQFLADASALSALAGEHRLASGGSLEFATSGGLVGYGVNFAGVFRRGATFVDKILKGENPGNIPMEQATRFRTVINLKTARALGLALSPTLLATADEVIE